MSVTLVTLGRDDGPTAEGPARAEGPVLYVFADDVFAISARVVLSSRPVEELKPIASVQRLAVIPAEGSVRVDSEYQTSRGGFPHRTSTWHIRVNARDHLEVLTRATPGAPLPSDEQFARAVALELGWRLDAAVAMPAAV